MQAGTRLEHYTIVDKLGEGGMGAVYRAEDTRLRRHVAIRVLPPAFAADLERLARLEREAQLLASLNHPNVASVYGFSEVDVDEASGRRHVAFLAMELVEGQSLHQRLAAGPLPWREAVEIAAGIAAGLEAAHERGIIHRDLKPANVHLTPDGVVKVLDFGLAKAVETGGGSGSLDLSASPTVQATRTGMILGTAGYMSPEQARGKTVDRRTDVWALGCVLFEMLTGRKTFEGETVSDVLAAILKEPVDLAALPPLPSRLRTLLERMLAKDPKQRMRDVGDVRLELQAALNEPAAPVAAATGLSWRVGVPAAAILLIAGAGIGWLLSDAPPPPPEAHVLLAPVTEALGLDPLAVSPDGTRIVESSPTQGIRLRTLDDLSWRTLPDTEGTPVLTFDSTGARVYFARGVEVLSVSVDGGSPIVEATFEAATQIYGLFRGIAGDVQASTWLAGESKIVRIPPGGGREELWRGTLNDSSRLIATTELAPGRWVTWAGRPNGSDGLVVVGASVAEPTVILDNYRSPSHAGDGDVLAVDERGRLALVRLDPDTGAVVAPPVVRVEGLALFGGSTPAYDLSPAGTLVYISGALVETGQTLTWLDRDGSHTTTTARRGQHDTDSRMAPDGLSLALEVAGTETSPISIWIHDLERDVRSALTPGIRATFPVWSPDSRRIIARLGDGLDPQGIYVVPVDRSGAPRLLLAEADDKRLLPMDWSPDGRWLLYVQSATLTRTRAGDNDVWRLPVDGGDPEPFLATGASEIDARYSPDGRWIAYASDQSGQYEIYLRPATGGGETRVSAEGGLDPEWNPAGGELFFMRGRDLYSVPVRADASRPVGAESRLLRLPETANARFLLPSADGRRFVISQFAVSEQSNAVHAILNWRRDAAR